MKNKICKYRPIYVIITNIVINNTQLCTANFRINLYFYHNMYAIVDIETTGGSPATDKITEIAIIIHDGRKVTDEFTTLINPERDIPYYITALTGITNEMVADAPRFYEVARKIVELTDQKTFVAHNSSFDYNFIRNEFKSLGYKFQREQLCTVKLSRKLIPGLRSYSLGTICNELDIEIHDRHRAAGDAMATARLFDILIDLNNTNGLELFSIEGILKNELHPLMDPDLIRNLPEDAGLYYFYNDKQELIYIGKSKNIKSRVITHINNNSSKRAIRMRQEIADISYELTGSELIALLKESEEIRNKKPLYNRNQRRALFQYGPYQEKDENDSDNIIIIDKGRNFEEYSTVKIENGKYIGYGYIDRDIRITDPEMVDDYISKYNDNRDIQNIIRKYLNSNRVINIIRF
ncbi:MAG: GIY-YIG nuclease family protein [Bacteroidales bacterium]|nr:MAG: GIY-YIG nuclease family protein [Bacteroidales bacterium]